MGCWLASMKDFSNSQPLGRKQYSSSEGTMIEGWTRDVVVIDFRMNGKCRCCVDIDVMSPVT